MTTEKIREDRLRRMAQRQGLVLQKSRRRDPYAVDYGTFTLIDARSNGAMYHATRVSLDEIEAFLTREQK